MPRNVKVVGNRPSDKLKKARMFKGWTLEETDEFLKMPRGRTYSYERGRAQPKPTFLAPLSEEWNIPIEWFFDGQDTPPPIGGVQAVHIVRETGYEIPLREPLPGGKWLQPANQAVRIFSSFPPASGTEARYIAVDSLPGLSRGDLVALSPTDQIREGVLTAVETPQGVTIGVAKGGAVLTGPDGEPIEGTPRAVVVVVRRTLPGGFSATLECEIGMTSDMSGWRP